MELYIARHGETIYNLEGRWQGSGVDTPLTENGVRQAKNLGKSIAGIDFCAIYSSPIKRAMDTARIAFNDHGLFKNPLDGNYNNDSIKLNDSNKLNELKKVNELNDSNKSNKSKMPPSITDDRLREIGLGVAEGMTYEEVGEKYTNAYLTLMAKPTEYTPPPQGETIEDIITRVASFLEDLSTKNYKKVFVLTHGYVLRVVYACSLDKTAASIGKSHRYENCEMARYVYDGSKWNLLSIAL